jgi:hypothetical protein
LANIDDAVLAHWQAVGADVLAASDKAIAAAITATELHEVPP